MDKIVEVLGKSLTKLGEYTSLFVIILILLVFLLIQFKKEITEYLKAKSKIKERKVKELEHHHLFVTMKLILFKIQESIIIENNDDDIKRLLFCKLSTIKINNLRIELTNFVLNFDETNYSENRLSYEIYNILGKVSEKSETEFINVCIDVFGISEEDAYFFFKKYEEVRFYITKAFYEEFESVVLDNFNNTKFGKISTVFYLLSLTISILPKDATKLIKSINGKFNKYNSPKLISKILKSI